MKYILVILIIVLFPVMCYSSDISIYSPNYSDGVVRDSFGIELILKSLFWISYEKPLITFGGQEAVDLSLLGAGVGYGVGLNRFLLFGKVGWYYPLPKFREGSYREAFWMGLMRRIAPPLSSPKLSDFYSFDYTIKPNFGVSIGVVTRILTTNWLEMNLYADYRYLKMRDMLYGYFTLPEKSNGHWESMSDINLSGYNIGLNFVF